VCKTELSNDKLPFLGYIGSKKLNFNSIVEINLFASTIENTADPIPTSAIEKITKFLT
jgi:hypothetical protein